MYEKINIIEVYEKVCFKNKFIFWEREWINKKKMQK